MILLNLFHTITHSWAASIFLLTLLLRLMLYPLNAWSMKSMRPNWSASSICRSSSSVGLGTPRHERDPLYRRTMTEITDE